MLKKIPFHYISDISHFNADEKSLFITPSPEKADLLRKTIQEDQLKSCFQIITINQFVRENIHHGKKVQKSELLTQLGVAWKKIYPNEPYLQFFRAFNLFTDLRGYSLDINLISSILENIDKKTQTAIQFFWNFCEQSNIYDENKIYEKLSQKFSHNEKYHEKINHFIFWGFEFFSNMQINFLESLGEKNMVDIFLPSRVLEGCGDFDWPSWISGKTVAPLTRRDTSEQSVKIIKHPVYYLNQTLLDFFSKNKFKNYDFILLKKDIDLEDILELPLRNHFFKVSANILKNLLEKSKGILQDFIEDNTSNVIEYADGCIQKSIENQNFRELKNWSLIKNFLTKWIEISDENSMFSHFDLELMFEVISLDNPNIFYRPYIVEGAGSILSVKEKSIDNDNIKIIIAQGKYPSLKSRKSLYPSNLLKILATLGPIKRSEFEFLFIEHTLSEIFRSNDAYIFIEDGLEENNPEWNHIVNLVEKQSKEIYIENTQNKPSPIILNKKIEDSGKISPSALQSYIDCPQMYYYKYREKMNRTPFLESVVDPTEKGIILHNVIERYLSLKKKFEKVFFLEVCHDEIEKFCSSDNRVKKLTKINNLLLENEIEQDSMNGIYTLLEFIKDKKIENFSLEFEKKIGNGRADCIVRSEQGNYLVDFKRSSSKSITKKDFYNYHVIQLWYYASRLTIEGNWSGLGYIYLNKEDEKKFFLENINESLDAYRKEEEKYEKRLKNDFEFKPNPRNKEICLYCPVKLICPRGSDL